MKTLWLVVDTVFKPVDFGLKRFRVRITVAGVGADVHLARVRIPASFNNIYQLVTNFRSHNMQFLVQVTKTNKSRRRLFFQDERPRHENVVENQEQLDVTLLKHENKQLLWLANERLVRQTDRGTESVELFDFVDSAVPMFNPASFSSCKFTHLGINGLHCCIMELLVFLRTSIDALDSRIINSRAVEVGFEKTRFFRFIKKLKSQKVRILICFFK